MSTEKNVQPNTKSAAVKVADKSTTASTQTAQPTAPKTVRKAVKKAPRKSAVKAPVKVKADTTAQPAAETKLKKPKLIRDSFTFPKDEYQAIAGLKQKALGLKHSAKKSEILRAGLKLLNSLNDKAFLTALTNVPALKTGRPAKS
jgi:hypothetical protein